MPKSKYPNQLDTSIEIPVVRDNITEIGSDVLNSLRSAIFKIEQTLGINPQGAIGNNVSNRLSSSLDENGNILKEALDRANVLSGPIIDADVSKVAAIQESKLKLNYPTQVLQSEISILNSQIDEIIEKVAEIAALLSAHINLNSLNRHNALQINVEEALVSPSDDAGGSLEAEDLQSALERIYNAHVNYTGVNISESNNSHEAGQVFYDNDLTSDIVSGDDVQTAIDDIANIGVTGLRNAILNLHSNGIIRSGSISDDFGEIDLGDILLDETSVTFNFSTTTTTLISLSEPTAPTKAVSQFDLLTLSGTYDDDLGNYSIKNVEYDGDDITGIEIFGNLKNDSASSASIIVTRNYYSLYNENSLNCAVRTKADHTNTPDVQIANPNAATIVSSKIKVENIGLDNNSFDISIDDEDSVTIYTYNEDLIEQTLDSIITMINDQAVSSHLNFMAYKLKKPTCYELALAHNLPNSATDHKNRTLKISEGSDSDGSEELGFSDILDLEIEGSTGNLYHINGYLHTEFGNITQLSVEDIYFIQGASRLTLVSEDAVDLDMRTGDLLIVSGSSDASDDGTYRIASISGKGVYLDDSSFSFAGEVGSDTIIFIVRATAGIGEMTFTEDVASDGVIMFDVFVKEDRNPYFSRRLEVDGALRSVGFLASVVDVSSNFIISGETATVSISIDGNATLTDPLGQVGEPVFVATDGYYNVYSADRMSFVVVKVFAQSYPALELSVDIYGFDEVSSDNLRLCRGIFGPTLGRVYGEDSIPGMPVLRDKRASGTTDKTIISANIIEKYIEGPRNELRSPGIIRGCEVGLHNSVSTTDSAGGAVVYQEVDVSSGIAYVNGIRFEILGHEAFRVNLEEDFYIGLDNEGCLVAEPDPESDGYASSPFYSQIVAHLAYVNITDSTIEDLRFFVDHLDYKLVSDITVAMDQRFGHFTEVEKAVDYARRFSYLFPTMPTPTILIKEGTYEVGRQLLLDFDVKISGVGAQTILRRTAASSSDQFLTGFVIDDVTYAIDFSFFLIGAGPTESSDGIINGVCIDSLTYEAPEYDAGHANFFIGVTQNADDSLSAGASGPPLISIKNIKFVGSNRDASITASVACGEGFLVYWQQNYELSTSYGVNPIDICSISVSDCEMDLLWSRTSPIMILEKNAIETSGFPLGSYIKIRDNIVLNHYRDSSGGFSIITMPSMHWEPGENGSLIVRNNLVCYE